MKRDWDLVRTILLRVEAQPNTQSLLRPNELEGFDAENVSYHIKLLIDAGLIEGLISKTLNAPIYAMARELTWQGHEFLDSIRNPGLWNAIKIKAREKAVDLTIDTIKALAKALLDELLGC